MSRKDLVVIAALLNELRAILTQAQHDKACALFASRLAAENPRFNEERFLKACGVKV